MEALYKKLFTRYTKLKKKIESGLEKIGRDQEIKFLSFVEASDALVGHLKSQNDRLCAKTRDLQSSIVVLRTDLAEQKSAYDSLHAERNGGGHLNQKAGTADELLLEKDRKIKELLEELEVLRGRDVRPSSKDEKSANELPNESVGCALASGEDSRPRTRKQRRKFRQDHELTLTAIATDQGDRGTSSGDNQPKCCKRRLGDSDIAVRTDCVFQELVECLVDMKLSVGIDTTNETFVSAVHESSGYSFSLTWITNAKGEEEFLYRVSSLGTFERVAPEWMRETIWFSRNMCAIFFQRVAKICNSC